MFLSKEGELMKILLGLWEKHPMSVILIGVFFLITVGFLIRKWRVLYKETKRLKNDIYDSTHTLPQSDHRNTFAQDYGQKIDPRLSEERCVFSHLWKEFTEQLIKPTSNSKEQVFQNSIRPQKFFTLEALCKKKGGLNLKSMESVSGILVALGVLGTFLGLTLSLLSLLDPSGIKVDDSTIKNLLSGASVAFITSVVGLFCSLVFSVVFDRKIFQVECSLEDFNSRLEKSCKFITEEHLLNEHLAQLNKHLGSMDEAIALKVGDQIECMGERLRGEISKGHQNISEKFLSDIVNKMTSGLGEFSKKQMATIDHTLTVLSENLPSLLSDLKNVQKESESQVKEVLSDIAVSARDSQQSINTSLAETVSNMKTEFEGIIDNLKQGMSETLSHSSGEMKEVISSLGQVNQKILKRANESHAVYTRSFNETAHKLHSFVSRLEEALSEINGTTSENIREAIDHFYKAAEKQEEIAEKNQQHIQSLNNLTESLQPLPHSLSKITQDFSELVQQINNSNEKLQTSWSNYESRFENVDKSAKEVFEKITEGLKDLSNKSANYIHELNGKTSEISGHFSGAVEDLRESIDDFSNKHPEYNKFFHSVEKLSKAIEDLSSHREKAS